MVHLLMHFARYIVRSLCCILIKLNSLQICAWSIVWLEPQGQVGLPTVVKVHMVMEIRLDFKEEAMLRLVVKVLQSP